LEILERVRTEEPTRPRRFRPSISLDLETICLKCLEKDPQKRYATAVALADDLNRFQEGKTIQARPAPLGEKLWRLVRRHPAPVGWGFAAVAVLSLLPLGWSYFSTSGQLNLHRAEARYQKFVERRNEALLYGLLAPNEGSLFLGAEAAANLKTAETAARDALALAGIDEDAKAPQMSHATASIFPMVRKAETDADCYALTLVLSSIRAERSLAGEQDRDRFRAALQILESSHQFGLKTRAYHLRRSQILEQMGEHQQAR